MPANFKYIKFIIVIFFIGQYTLMMSSFFRKFYATRKWYSLLVVTFNIFFSFFIPIGFLSELFLSFNFTTLYRCLFILVWILPFFLSKFLNLEKHLLIYSNKIDTSELSYLEVTFPYFYLTKRKIIFSISFAITILTWSIFVFLPPSFVIYTFQSFDPFIAKLIGGFLMMFFVYFLSKKSFLIGERFLIFACRAFDEEYEDFLSLIKSLK